MADIKPFTGHKQQNMNINLDINALPDMPCIKCGEKEFQNITRIKKLSRTISPNGQEGNVNVNMLKCSKCGWLFNPKEWEDAQIEDIPPVEQRSISKDLDPDDNKILCRKCGSFYVRGTTHICDTVSFNDTVNTD